jgi:hypothetical protein
LRAWRLFVLENLVDFLIIGGSSPACGNRWPAAAIVAKGWAVIVVAIGSRTATIRIKIAARIPGTTPQRVVPKRGRIRKRL